MSPTAPQTAIGRRAAMCLVAGVLGCTPPPPSPPVERHADDAPPSGNPGGDEARDPLGEGLFLESAAGDYAAAAELYRQGAAASNADRHARAELLFRRGEALEVLGRVGEAEEAYRAVADELGDVADWAEMARSRMSRLVETEDAVRGLPLTLDFDSGLRGWRHSRRYVGRGTLVHQTDPGLVHSGAGAIEWRTTVAGQKDDLLYLPLDLSGAALREIRMQVRVIGFPAHLFLFAVEADGRRFSTEGFTVSPDEGWSSHAFELPRDFRPIAGQGEAGPFDPTRLSFLMLQDATGYFSTDRGENRILLDDLQLR